MSSSMALLLLLWSIESIGRIGLRENWYPVSINKSDPLWYCLSPYTSSHSHFPSSLNAHSSVSLAKHKTGSPDKGE